MVGKQPVTMQNFPSKNALMVFRAGSVFYEALDYDGLTGHLRDITQAIENQVVSGNFSIEDGDQIGVTGDVSVVQLMGLKLALLVM